MVHGHKEDEEGQELYHSVLELDPIDIHRVNTPQRAKTRVVGKGVCF